MLTLFVQLIFDGMGMGLIYVILAVGLVLILNVSRIFFIAYGQFYMVGAYAVWGGSVLLGLPFLASLCIAVLTTVILALMSYRLIFHYIQYMERQFLAMIVAAIGLMMVLGQAGLVLFGTSPRGLSTIFPGIAQFAGINVSVEKLVLIGLALLITLTMFFVYEKTSIGWAMQAVSFNPEAASLMGINTQRIYLVTMGIGGALAGFAGGIMAPVYAAYPEMGQEIILSVILVIMLGGMGSLVGAVLGGIIMGLTLSFGQYFTGGLVQILLFVIVGIILLVR
ncbi:MAG: branched-chain amino acid ABC transporter permease, partial [Thermodesulfobacteriota bacterium]